MADGPSSSAIHSKSTTFDVVQSSHKLSSFRQRNPKNLKANESSPQQATKGSMHTQRFHARPTPSSRPSVSHMQLDHMWNSEDISVNDYDVQELRDGFFDASFKKPRARQPPDDIRKASATFPGSFQRSHRLSASRFVPQQITGVKGFVRKTTTSRAGLKLFKSFIGFFICYIICLIPTSRDWLGKYNYIMVISAIVNHPGRKVGSQFDGAVLTILGTIAGLAWGSLALYVSSTNATARHGYGGVLASFLVVFTIIIGWLRCVYIRFYQAVLCAGFAIFYVCFADTSTSVSWSKVLDYGIPFVLGQAVCFVVSTFVFPDAGSRSLAIAIHESLETIQEGLELPSQHIPSLKRDLAWHFVNLSTAVRDFAIEFAVSCFQSNDMPTIRNLIQAVIRSLISIKPETNLFDLRSEHLNIDGHPSPGAVDGHAANLIRHLLADPTRSLIDAMKVSIQKADNAILHLGGQKATSESIAPAVDKLRTAKEQFDSADLALLSRPDLPASYAKRPDCIDLLLFLHPVRQAADKVEAFAEHVLEMQARNKGWRIRMPTYPWRKASTRTNAQVRHDRGGLTAGFYFRSQKQMHRTMADLQSTAYVPYRTHAHVDEKPEELSAIGEYEREKRLDNGMTPVQARMAILRHKVWAGLHRLQGFESRFAFKITLVITLISVPAWLPQSQGWWNDNGSWWAVVMVWIMMHPRVGGTFQDLIVRVSCAALGAVWGGLAYAADNGNPYVIAIFAAIYVVPMLYRFTQSSHPRSGVVGCMSFTIVSLSIYTDVTPKSIVHMTWTRGLAFVVGIFAAIVVNWVLWPFIARHELRKSLAAMLLHSAILYRGVVSKYIYYKEGQQPGPSDIARSEMLEGRLREGFVRIEQLLELTRHEMRLRAPFNPLPYSALISACEAFFEHLVQVRQSSLYFQPSMLAPSSSTAASLTSYRRDAVAAILLNLYTYACALRGDQPVPRYVPSAAAARQKLLDRMKVVEAQVAARERAEDLVNLKSLDSFPSGHSAKVARERGQRRWADVYEYALSGALTDIVGEVQEMQRFTTEICGEAQWD